MATSSGNGKMDPPTESGSQEGRPTSDEVQEWEKRLISGDLPEDFLEVTEPQGGAAEGTRAVANAGAAGEPMAAGVTANATATVTSIKSESKGPATGDLLGLDTSEPPKEPQTVGRDPNLSANTEEMSDPGRPMTTEEKDHAMALALQKQLNMESQEEASRAAAYGAAGYQFGIQAPPPNAIGKLTITVAEARLTKNYGIARMDPYCRVRVGHCVYETPTCANGAREPKWNKTFNCFLLAGVKNIDIEIYDECTFQTDAMIAHATFIIPENVMQKQEVADEWWPLSGQEGHDKEGMLHLILSLQPLSKSSQKQTMIQVQPGQNVRIPQSQQPAAQQQDQPQQPPPPPQLSDEQLQEFCKMFPNLDKDVILSVYQENRGNQESTVNGLLVISGS